MKSIKINALIFTVSLIFVACAGEDRNTITSPESDYPSGVYSSESNYDDNYGDSNYEESEAAAASETVLNESDELTEDLSLDRKLIKNANMSFETDSLAVRKQIVKDAVKKYKAYVENEEQFMEYDREVVETTIRIPGEHFDDFMDEVTNGVGSFDTKTIAVSDVTEEFVDVQARIETKKELKIRFTKLLDKAESIAKIMEVEREITALQAEIESYEGRLKYLSGSIKYATITMSYYRMLEIPTEFDNKFESAFKGGWEALVWFFVGLVSVWPIVLIVIFVLSFIKIRSNMRKAKVS